MIRDDRGLDDDFQSNEKLFFRCKAEWIDQNGRIRLAHVRAPDQSVNREKFSKRYDVLLPIDDTSSPKLIYWGVASVDVQDVPTHGVSTGGLIFSFTVEHDPLENNYGHTELRAYKNNKREMKSDNINKAVRKEYRAKLAERTRIEISPLI
ncbi:MAG: hypothetical protein SGJ20_16860 [Planctomycetota bacterium]|nr:hypothetical protein [Planctomycetota bacterium]